jgi:hypothetical protein
MSALMDRLSVLGRQLAQSWLHASIYRTVWSLPLPLVLLIAGLLAGWLVWVGP